MVNFVQYFVRLFKQLISSLSLFTSVNYLEPLLET